MPLPRNRPIFAGAVVYAVGFLSLLYAFVGDPPGPVYDLLFDGGFALAVVGGLVLGYGIYVAAKPTDA
ncbi:MAG: hypothetical protein ABEJ23_02405 [Haloarculaceae archaeon]